MPLQASGGSAHARLGTGLDHPAAGLPATPPGGLGSGTRRTVPWLGWLTSSSSRFATRDFDGAGTGSGTASSALRLVPAATLTAALAELPAARPLRCAAIPIQIHANKYSARNCPALCGHPVPPRIWGLRRHWDPTPSRPPEADRMPTIASRRLLDTLQANAWSEERPDPGLSSGCARLHAPVGPCMHGIGASTPEQGLGCPRSLLRPASPHTAGLSTL